MLTGEVPFPKKRDVEVIMAHVGEPPPKATEKREGLPAEIDDVIAKAMAKEPGDRYDELHRVLRGGLGRRSPRSPTRTSTTDGSAPGRARTSST